MELIEKIKREKLQKQTTLFNNNKKKQQETKTTKKSKPVYKEYVGVNSPSLNQLKNNNISTENSTKKESKTTLATDKIEDFTQQELNEVWLDYIETIKNNMIVYQLLKNQNPKKKSDFKLEIVAINKAQKKEIESVLYNSMSFFLQKNLNNNKISIIVKLEESENNKVIYGDANIYKHLLNKNNNLQILKEVFNLDFE